MLAVAPRTLPPLRDRLDLLRCCKKNGHTPKDVPVKHALLDYLEPDLDLTHEHSTDLGPGNKLPMLVIQEVSGRKPIADSVRRL